jgi:hypothetical protein
MSPGQDLEELFPDCDWFAFVTNFPPVLGLSAWADNPGCGADLLVVLMDLTDGAETFFSPKTCSINMTPMVKKHLKHT